MPSLSSLFSLRRRAREPVDHIAIAKRQRGAAAYPRAVRTFTLRRCLTPCNDPSTAQLQSQSQLQSPLLSLPFELREHIWSLVAGPSRSVTLEHGMIRRCATGDYFQTEASDIRGWETELLQTCKQVYAELLPILLRVVQLKTSEEGVMIRLPELLPQHRLNAIRHVELLSWTSDAPDMRIGLEDEIRKSRNRQWIGGVTMKLRSTPMENATMIRAICMALGAMEGLTVMKWKFIISRTWQLEWDVAEPDIVNEINRARNKKKGWTVMFLGEDQCENVERNYDGLIVIKKC